MIALSLAVVQGLPSHADTRPIYDGVSWNPNQDLTFEQDTSGCHTKETASITVPDPTLRKEIAATLDTNKNFKPSDTDAGKEVELLQINHVQETSNSLTLEMDAWVNYTVCAANNDPPALTAFRSAPRQSGSQVENAAFRTGPQGSAASRTVPVGGSVHLASFPQWIKDAVAAVAADAAYVALSVLLVAVVTSTAATAGATGVTASLVTATAGCIAGAAASGMVLGLSGAANDWKSILSTLIAGCAGGALVAVLPIEKWGGRVGDAIRTYFGASSAPVASAELTTVAAQAGAQESVIPSVMNATAADLAALP